MPSEILQRATFGLLCALLAIAPYPANAGGNSTARSALPPSPLKPDTFASAPYTDSFLKHPCIRVRHPCRALAQNAAARDRQKGLQILSRAVQAAQKLDNQNETLFYSLALVYLKAGEEERAGEVLSLGMNGFLESIAMSARTRGGLQNSEELERLASKFAKIGQAAPVFKLAAAIENSQHRNIVLIAIARAFFKEGGAKQALEIVRQIEHEGDKAIALEGIAEKSVEVSLADEALEIAQSLETADKDGIIERKAEAVAAIALSYARAGEKNKAAQTFALAREIAETAYSPYNRLGAVQAIAIRSIEAGDFDGAFALVEKIPSDAFVAPELLSAIARSYAEAGQIKPILKIAAILESSDSTDSEKLRHFGDIIAVIARAGEPDRALEFAKRMQVDSTKKHIKENALASVVIGYVIAKRYSEALQLVGELEDGIYKNSGLEAIALSYASAGEFERSAEIAERIKTDSGGEEGIFYAIATQAARKGNYDVAVKIVEKIGNQGWRKDTALSEIAREAGKAGNYEVALEIARKISLDGGDRNKVLLQIGWMLAKAGQAEKAEGIFSESLQQAQAIKDEYRRSSAVREIAILYAETGQHAKATSLAETLKSQEDKRDVVRAIAFNYVSAGNPETALEIAARAGGDSSIKDAVIYASAWKAAEAGNFDRAVEWVEQMGDNSNKAQALAGIAAIALGIEGDR